jgi:hypothetical protein
MITNPERVIGLTASRSRGWTQSRVGQFNPIFVLLGAAIGGCMPEPNIEYRAVTGRFERITPATRVAVFAYENPDSGDPREVTTYIPHEVEVLINGRLSEISDLELNETVDTIWAVEKYPDGQEDIIALKIRAIRDRSLADENR